MKGLKFGNKLVFLVNTVSAFLLLLSYILQYIPPKQFALLSVLSLTVPLLIVINILFCLYWLLGLKKQLLLSLIVLLLGYRYINTMYKLSSVKPTENAKQISIMNYNVRIFNLYNWLPNTNVKKDVKAFIEAEQPDIICLQEYHAKAPLQINNYNKFVFLTDKKSKTGQVIFSKFKIIDSGSVNFPNTGNNAIFVDIVKQNDTVRVYNLHMQSSGINPKIETLNKKNSSDLFKQVGKTFKIQQDQAELFLKHKLKCPYKTIIAGDFNNTAYSYLYRVIKADFKDAFEAAGSGFGSTYDFKYFPLRIDFILLDSAFKVSDFKTYDVKLSDHFPIKAVLELH